MERTKEDKVKRSGLREGLETQPNLGEAPRGRRVVEARPPRVRQGINFFDTANIYHVGKSEMAVGKALKGPPALSIFLATKLFFPMD